MPLEPLSLPTECYSRGAPTDRQMLFTHTDRHVVAVREQLSEADENATLVEMPRGTKSMICVGRMCGDFHVDLQGDRFHVASIGDNPKAAVLAAVAKVAA